MWHFKVLLVSVTTALLARGCNAIEVFAEDPEVVDVGDKLTLECEVTDLDDGQVFEHKFY